MNKQEKVIDQNDYLSMIKMEYGAMREEIHLSHSHIFIILQLFFPIVGVLLGVAVDHADNREILNSVLSLMIPMISLSSITFVLSESIRMKRAGDYICVLESKVDLLKLQHQEPNKSWQKNIEKELNLQNSNVSLFRPLAFESWIRSFPDKHTPYGRASYILQLRFIIFFLVLVGSIVASFFVGRYDYKQAMNLNVEETKSIIDFICFFHLQIVGSLISAFWGILILICGFKFSNQCRNQYST